MSPWSSAATLQQETSRRVGFGGRRIMRLAQALYEGVDLDGGAAGRSRPLRRGLAACEGPGCALARAMPGGPRGHRVRLALDVVQPGAGGFDRHGAVAKPRPQPVHPPPARALAADRGQRCAHGGRLGRRGLRLRSVRAVRSRFFRRRQNGAGHGRPAVEREADPAHRLLGDCAKLARAVAEVGGEGAERGGFLAEPAKLGLADEPGEEERTERARR